MLHQNLMAGMEIQVECFSWKCKIKAQKLVETTFEAMMRGIEQVKPGNTTGDIGYAIQSFAEKKNYSVVRDFSDMDLVKYFRSTKYSSFW